MMSLPFQKKYRSPVQTKVLKGFSLGEVLLAAFVMTVGLLSISALMATSLRQSFQTRDTIIAIQLAQEGVELARNQRDNSAAFQTEGNNGMFLLDNSSSTIFSRFSRSVTVAPSGQQAKVTSKVWWSGGSAPGSCTVGNKCVYTEVTLTNWN